MDYTATYPDTFIRFYASDMVLNIDIDVSYLVLPNEKSRVAGYHHFKTSNEILNVPIHGECKALKHVVSSAADAKTGGIFVKPQPPVPIKMDNIASTGFLHNNIQLKRIKSWDMQHYWLQYKETHK